VTLDGEIVARVAAGAARVDLLPFAPESVRLEDFAGRYYSTELETEYDLRVEDGRLTMHHSRLSPIALQAYQPDLFAGADAIFGRFAFERDAAGQVVGFRLSGPVVDGVAFVRRPAP
jgi:hypothetical protein